MTVERRSPLPVLDVPSRLSANPRPAARPNGELEQYAVDELVQPSFHVWTLGCQMNQSDSEEMAGALLATGCAEAASIESAELIVINTCSIREAAEQKVIGRMGALGKLKAANPAVRVVLTGCSVRADNEAILERRYPAVDLFLRPDEEPELTARLGLSAPTTPDQLSEAGFARVGVSVAATADRLPGTRATAVAGEQVARNRGVKAWVPIIYGCDKTCTYCIVPFARGPERSRPFDDIVAETEALAQSGYREITLLGQNVNSWGHDLALDPRFADVAASREIGRQLPLDGRPDIASLLWAIEDVRDSQGTPAIGRVRFVTSHPWDLTDRLIDAMARCTSVCEHLHLPVQSGDDAVLRRMGRQYTIESYLDLVGRLRAAVPGISLTTDIIVGFCGETEAQFEGTLDLLREVRFDQVFAASYSQRPGTPATRLDDDVPAKEKRRRLNALLALQETIGAELNAGWVGRQTEVLVDEVRAARSHDHESETAGSVATRLVGRNREHKLVHFNGAESLVGQIVQVEIERAGAYSLNGQMLKAPYDA
jgi:tRNA-2-methylthio-N6-dimethylallyladenosine synthase